MKNAYVTGASQGIGKEFARALAKEYNVFLVSRSQSDLNSAIAELEPMSKGMLKSISLDLSKKKGQEEFSEILKKDSDFELLVNNAGFGTVGEFATLDLERELEEINLNVKALVTFSHVAINAFKKRKKGFIINVASIAGFLPAPGSATYAATKAYVKSFTEAIHEEASPYGIYVQSLCPGLTHSDFHQRAGIEKSKYPNIMWQTASEVVEESLNALRSNSAVCITGTINQGLVGLTGILPRSWVRKTAARFMESSEK
jgi:short-subunit dehydrogenase